MKKRIAFLRLLIFAGIFVCIFLILEKIFYNESILHPTWKYVSDSSHEPIDILYVGNSHTYTTVDPEVISLATGLNVRALTCASINGEIVEEDLEAFLNYEVPQVVVLEMCPFSVNNFEIMETDKVGIWFRHFDGIPDTTTRFYAVKDLASFENILPGTFQLLRNSEMWERWGKKEGNQSGYEMYGSNKKWDVYYDSHFNAIELEKISAEYEPATDDECMNARNRKALESIIQLSEKYGFDIWIYNAPLSEFRKEYSNALSYVYSLQKDNTAIKYIDDSMKHLQDIGITKTDYYDTGHLNPNGMQKVTKWMIGKIAERFDVNVDASRISRYYSTKVEMLEADLFQYEVDSWGEALYAFEYVNAEGEKIKTDFSDTNVFKESVISTKDIKVYIKSKSEEKEEIVEYPFLPYTLTGYTVSITDGNILEVENHSNFADDLVFAWYLINKTEDTTEKHMYQENNKVTLTLERSGEYQIRAYTKQDSTGIKRNEGIMTFEYDDKKKAITIESSLDSVNIK